MKHAAIPLRRIIEPRVCEDDAFPWDYDPFESFVAGCEEQLDEGEEYQRSAIAEHASMQVRSHRR